MTVWYIILSRFAREQLGDVSKVLLDGLYDAESPLSMIRGHHYFFMKDVWEMVSQDRYVYLFKLNSSVKLI